MTNNKWKIAGISVIAAVTTIVSSAVPGTVFARYPDIMGCEQSCSVVAGGWPFPYLVDYPGISPAGSVSLFMLDVDVIWPGALAATFLCWLALILGLTWVVRKVLFR